MTRGKAKDPRLDRKAVEAGQYYAKRNANDWLRLILRRYGDDIIYADSFGIGLCSIGRLVNWAAERGPLSADELAEVQSEIAKIRAIYLSNRIAK
jgi:hypothetical protein